MYKELIKEFKIRFREINEEEDLTKFVHLCCLFDLKLLTNSLVELDFAQSKSLKLAEISSLIDRFETAQHAIEWSEENYLKRLIKFCHTGK